jgi:hypothetical protein
MTAHFPTFAGDCSSRSPACSSLQALKDKDWRGPDRSDLRSQAGRRERCAHLLIVDRRIAVVGGAGADRLQVVSVAATVNVLVDLFEFPWSTTTPPGRQWPPTGAGADPVVSRSSLGGTVKKTV